MSDIVQTDLFKKLLDKIDVQNEHLEDMVQSVDRLHTALETIIETLNFRLS